MNYRWLPKLGAAACLLLAAFTQTGICVGAEEEGSAFVGRLPTEIEQAFDQDRGAAAQAYGNCLLDAPDAWFSSPDYESCDGLREAYRALLSGEIGHLAVGCLEEGVLGSPRVAEHTCAALHRRFPIVVSHFQSEEESP